MREMEDEPIFAIGVVARLVGTHQQTLRNYEKWGLVEPKRSDGGTRFYSQRDVKQITKIKDWIDTLGLNRAGVQVMLKLVSDIEFLQGELDSAKNELHKNTEEGEKKLYGD